ncbi:MAG: diaminopimelate epimerase [Pseudonocardiales bacterium]|jgi:diaminopimelate epimerase|nr:diaminopimelate epimerase [Pseudonocardiales bacterium]
MRVLKGHGTENDFVVVPDLDGALALTPALVRALCDRHTGIGADGVLRVVRSENDRDAKEMALEAPFFMDYRNADGSVAEMCGNGIRVFMRYLQGAGLVDTSAAVATRGGIRSVVADAGGDFTVDMGHPLVRADRPVVTAAPMAATTGAAIQLPNPHVVVFLGSRTQLDALDLSQPPRVDPTGPAGQNVEFVVLSGPRQLFMRVHERGVGETRSCGTGICAAAVAAAISDGVGADGLPWRVDVPGGTCTVVWDDQTGVRLQGPAVIVGEMELDDAWLRSVAG